MDSAQIVKPLYLFSAIVGRISYCENIKKSLSPPIIVNLIDGIVNWKSDFSGCFWY